jgi:hypothetical protein
MYLFALPDRFAVTFSFDVQRIYIGQVCSLQRLRSANNKIVYLIKRSAHKVCFWAGTGACIINGTLPNNVANIISICPKKLGFGIYRMFLPLA